MSNFLAIATVTAALRRALLEVVQIDVPGAEVTTVRPDEQGSGGVPARGVNIFLYEVAPNGALRNADLPTRRSSGQVVERPQVALNLDYLLSFYGNEAALEPQRLLGSTVRSLHARPRLTQAMINAAVTDAAFAFLAPSDLAEQLELVKFTPLTLTLEDLSKLWSVFFQTRYVLSVAYQASVVLIEGKAQPHPVLPVRDYTLHVVSLRQPAIERTVAQAGDEQPILAESPVHIVGSNFRGEVTQVVVAGKDVTPSKVTDSRIDLTLPAGLRAGVQGMQVHHAFMAGTPSEPHRSLASNLGAFVLHPVVTKTNGNYNITVNNPQGTGNAPRSADIVVGLAPTVGKDQQVTLELLAVSGQVRMFFAAPRSAAANQVTFPVSGLQPGNYLLRVRVDGAETPFELDANDQPVAPKVTLQ